MSKEVRNPSAPGDHELGIEIGQRLEDESALVQTRMGNAKARLIHHVVGIDEQVQVDLSGAPPPPVPRAPELTLDPKQRVEKLARRQRRLDRGCAVQEARLVEYADGIGLAQLRYGDDFDAIRLGEKLDRAAEGLFARAKVRTQTNVRTGHGMRRSGSDREV